MFLYFVVILVSVSVTWFLNRPKNKPVESLHISDLKIIEPEVDYDNGDIYDLLKKIATKNVSEQSPVYVTYPVHVTYSVNGFKYKICLDLSGHVIDYQIHNVPRQIIHAYLIKNDTVLDNVSITKDITETLIMYQGPNSDFYYTVPQASKKLSDILYGILGPEWSEWDTLCIYDLHGIETFIDLKKDKYIYLV